MMVINLVTRDSWLFKFKCRTWVQKKIKIECVNFFLWNNWKSWRLLKQSKYFFIIKVSFWLKCCYQPGRYYSIGMRLLKFSVEKPWVFRASFWVFFAISVPLVRYYKSMLRSLKTLTYFVFWVSIYLHKPTVVSNNWYLSFLIMIQWWMA